MLPYMVNGLMMTIIFLHDVTKYIHNSASNPQVIKIYTLISSFMPAISALSGNLGLQAGSNTIRGLCTGEPQTDSVDIRVDNYRYCPGHIHPGNYVSNMVREIRSGLVTATLLASVLAGVAVVWSYCDRDNQHILKE